MSISQDHIDALISLALWGPGGREVAPGHWHHPHWFAVPPTPDTDVRALQQISRTIDVHTCDAVGRMLVAANVRSLACRYPDAAASGIIPAWTGQYRCRASLWHQRPTAVEGLKLIACFRYQSCECPDWRDSEAASFCDSLEHALIACLPGSDKAPWEWRRKQS